MAFVWDNVQENWLERRLAGGARRFETKVRVAGSSLEIDAAAEDPTGDDFFDFLSRLCLFENKAPSEVFAWPDLLLVGARTLLFAERRKLDWPALQELTQVVLCSRTTAELRARFRMRALRPGVWEGSFYTRLVVVEANELEVRDETLPLLVHYASGPQLVEAVEGIVSGHRSEYYGVLWFLRKHVFREVLRAMNETVDETSIDIREAVEELGVEHVFEAVGVKRVVDAVGLERVIEAVGLERVIEAVGPAAILELLGTARVKDWLEQQPTAKLRPVGSGRKPRRKRKDSP